jgi:integrase
MEATPMSVDQKAVLSAVQLPSYCSQVAIEDDVLPLVSAWNEARDQWLQTKGIRSQNTRRTYQVAVGQFLEWAGVFPWRVTSLIAQARVTWMTTEGKLLAPDRKTGEVKWGPLASRTCRLRLSALNSFYRFVGSEYLIPYPEQPVLLHTFRVLAARELVSWTSDGISLWQPDRPNPFEAVDRPRLVRADCARSPSTEELKAMLAEINTGTVSGKRDLALLLALAWIPGRASEVLALKWGDIVSMSEGVRRFRRRGRDIKSSGQTKPDQQLCRAIHDYLMATGRLHSVQPDDHIFVPLDPERITRLRPGIKAAPNKPISQHTAAGILKKYARRIGMDPRRACLHGLRRAGADWRHEVTGKHDDVCYL